MRGLFTPFRRDGARDLASGEGLDLALSKVRQVLGTQAGECPWRTNFGADLARLRHQPNTRALEGLARVRVQEALRRWAPGVKVVAVYSRRDGHALWLDIQVRIGEQTRVLDLEVPGRGVAP